MAPRWFLLLASFPLPPAAACRAAGAPLGLNYLGRFFLMQSTQWDAYTTNDANNATGWMGTANGDGQTGIAPWDVWPTEYGPGPQYASADPYSPAVTMPPESFPSPAVNQLFGAPHSFNFSLPPPPVPGFYVPPKYPPYVAKDHYCSINPNTTSFVSAGNTLSNADVRPEPFAPSFYGHMPINPYPPNTSSPHPNHLRLDHDRRSSIYGQSLFPSSDGFVMDSISVAERSRPFSTQSSSSASSRFASTEPLDWDSLSVFDASTRSSSPLGEIPVLPVEVSMLRFWSDSRYRIVRESILTLTDPDSALNFTMDSAWILHWFSFLMLQFYSTTRTTLNFAMPRRSARQIRTRELLNIFLDHHTARVKAFLHRKNRAKQGFARTGLTSEDGEMDLSQGAQVTVMRGNDSRTDSGIDSGPVSTPESKHRFCVDSEKHRFWRRFLIKNRCQNRQLNRRQNRRRFSALTSPNGLKLTSQKTIHRLERVHGMPSELPHPKTPTAFIIQVPKDELPAGMTVDNYLRSLSPHSWGASTGHRSSVDNQLSGLFFPGRAAQEKIDCRRAVPVCGGVLVCPSLDRALLEMERRELDPEPRANLAQATLRQREQQDDTLVGKAVSFGRSLEHVYCRGTLADGTRCRGTVSVLRPLKQRSYGKDYGLECSTSGVAIATGSCHTSTYIPEWIDEHVLYSVQAGEQVLEDDDCEEICLMVKSLSGLSGPPPDCDFSHFRNGKPFQATMYSHPCKAKMTLFCPIELTYCDEEKYGDLIRCFIAFPDPVQYHKHPSPLASKCPCTVREKYKAVVRAFGPGATVAKVETGESHFAQSLPFLTESSAEHLCDPREDSQRLSRQFNKCPLQTTSRAPELAAFVARKQSVVDVKQRYIHSMTSRSGSRIILGAYPALLVYIHELRALDFDTSFKPVKGKFEMFELNGWLASHNCTITVFRVWMEIHDQDAFKYVWSELFRLVLVLTSRPLHFKRLHRGGKVLGLNADMEAAPLLAFADAIWDSIPAAKQLEIGDTESTLHYVLRICGVHFNRGIDKTLEHLPSTTRKQLKELRHLRSPSELADYEAWMMTIDDPTGALGRWWAHKKMHRWLLPGLVQSLSKIPKDDWQLLSPSTNLGEGQHRWNNVQTGIDMAPIESMINKMNTCRYEELDCATAARLQRGAITGDLHNDRNNVVHRYANGTTRQIARGEKMRRGAEVDRMVRLREVALIEATERWETAKEAATSAPSPTANELVKKLRIEMDQAKADMKQAKAEAKSNSSGRVKAPPRPRTLLHSTPDDATGASEAPSRPPTPEAVAVSACPAPTGASEVPSRPPTPATVAVSLPDHTSNAQSLNDAPVIVAGCSDQQTRPRRVIPVKRPAIASTSAPSAKRAKKDPLNKSVAVTHHNNI
ncbi:hypothetical protein K438DRAFT_1776098 [Mycena galopus ATCC 62051]|nr:hypothetical protein K438DRAFT_1776098 [Mycena galopus ATCC 62051]